MKESPPFLGNTRYREMAGVSQRVFLARTDAGPCLVMIPLLCREGREELPFFSLDVSDRHAWTK